MRVLILAACLLSVTSCGGSTYEKQVSNAIEVVPVDTTQYDLDVTAGKTAEGAGDRQLPCDAIRGRLATLIDCREYARQRSALAQGVAAFDPPRNMPVGTTQTVTLQVGAVADAAEVVAAAGGNAASATKLDVTIGDYVSAELAAPADLFEINPAGAVVKQLPDNRRQVWQWGVKPLVAGRHKLTLTIGVPAVGGASAAAFFLDPKVYEIEVRARPRTWAEIFDEIAKFFTSLKGVLLGFAAVITALGGVYWAIRHFGEKPDDEQVPKDD